MLGQQFSLLLVCFNTAESLTHNESGQVLISRITVHLKRYFTCPRSALLRTYNDSRTIKSILDAFHFCKASGLRHCPPEKGKLMSFLAALDVPYRIRVTLVRSCQG